MGRFDRTPDDWHRNALFLAAGFALVTSLSAGPVCAQVTGISYTLTPLAEGMRFENNAALKSSFFYGGKLGFGFGEFIELNGLYLFGPSVETELGNLSGYDDATAALLRGLPTRSLDIHRFGGELKFNIGRSTMFPFVTLGTGALRFEPEGLNESNTIYLSGGLGLQFSLRERYTVVLQATGLAYRYNPAAALMSEDDIAALGMAADDFDLVNVRDFGASIGVKFYLGGRRSGDLSDMDRAFQEQFRRGWRGIDFRLEPAGGEIDFDEALGYRRNHRFASLSVGIDLGAYAGLRAFYWRGIEDGSWTAFDDLQAYGGELKLAFADGSGSLAPYFMVGGGYIDVMTGYAGNGLALAEDRPFALGGIGLILPLGTALSLDAAVRSLIMSTAGVDNVSDPGSIETSTMFAVGISFGLGGGRRESVFGREMAASKIERERLSTEVSGLELKLNELRSRMDSMAAVAGGHLAPGVDSSALRGSVKGSPGGPRWVTLPVPEEGELYLRFGAPGGVSVETIEGEPLTYYLDPTTGTLMLAAPPSVEKPAAPGAVPAAAPQDARMPSSGTAVPAGQASPTAAGAPAPSIGAAGPSVESLENIIRRVFREEHSSAAAQPATPAREPAPLVIEVPAAEAAPAAELTAEGDAEIAIEEAAPRAPSTRFAGLSPLTGYNFDAPHQGLIGVRADFVHRAKPYRLVPELVMGFGDDKTTINFNLNGFYDLGVSLLERLHPYGGIGLGLLHRDELELVLNLVIGTDIQIGTSTLFLEYVNQDFFDNNRLLAGYRFSF